MIKSMTGFGRGEFTDGKRNVTVEIKTVNHRYMDINIKLPRRYSFAEEGVKAVIKEKLKRGKADVSVMIENLAEGDMTVKLSEDVAGQYIENLRNLKEGFGLAGDVDLRLIASMPDVFRIIPDVEDEEEAAHAVREAARLAAENLDAMRAVEGAKLAEDLKMRGGLVRETVRKIGERAPLVAEEYTAKLRTRIAELIGDDIEVPEDRIITEAAIFADRANITEELVRLDSHMMQLDRILSAGEEPSGKKLDFLVQEMNREANTIGSKANDMEITSLMLEAKSEIEKIREQVQNIE